jgi:hypothetical protein
MVDEDEAITIDHLVGRLCLLNRTTQVEVIRSRKSKVLRLSVEGMSYSYEVIEVTDLGRDGSFVLTVKNPQGSILTGQRLIKKSLLIKK